MADRVWCPTRGYFEIGGGGEAPQSGDASPEEVATAEDAAGTEEVAESVGSGGAAGGGSQVWAPSRGYFAVGGGSAKAAAPAKKTPAEKNVPAKAAADKPAPAKASKPAAVRKQSTEKAAKKPVAVVAVPTPESDPRRDSVTTVPTLTGKPIGVGAGTQIYDEPDSETTLYRVSTLNVAFFVLSALLLFYTLAVIWKDYSRDWKSIQAEWNRELVNNYEKDLNEARSAAEAEVAELRPAVVEMLAAVDPEGVADTIEGATNRARGDRLDEFQRLIESAQDALDDHDPEYVKIAQAKEDTDTRHSLKARDMRMFRGVFQAKRFEFEEMKRYVLEEEGDTEAARHRVEAIESQFAVEYVTPLEALSAEVEVLQGEADQANAVYEQYVKTKEFDGRTLFDLETELKAVSFRVNQLIGNVTLIETNWKNVARNLPLLDFMAPSYEIKKVITDDLHEDLQLLTMPRIDRCQTCHINIDDPSPKLVGYEHRDWGSVYASHPRLDLFVGSASPHPYAEFGCTACHFGDGHATDFTRASHTPNNEEQKKKWEKKFHWHQMHHQDWPMLEKKYLNSSCGKCHQEEHRLEGGGAWNEGYELVKTYGCYGCHKIDAFENEDKVGPTLTYISDKTSTDWLYKWIRNPPSFRPSTYMPQFFDLSNTGGMIHGMADEAASPDGVMYMQGADDEMVRVDFRTRNAVESLSLATYLAETSERRVGYTVKGEGDEVRGREAFRTRGCLGCHSVKQESMTPDEGGTPEALAKLLVAARTRLDALKGGVAEQAALALTTRKSLDGLAHFFDTLAVGEKVAEHYRRVMVPTSALEEAGVDVAAVKEAAAAIYNRWVHNTRAPDLSAIGSKITDPDWLADWIVNPRGHDAKTIMPRLRIREETVSEEAGDQEIADIVAYLLTLKSTDFDNRPSFAIDTDDKRKVLSDLTYDYLRRELTRTESRKLIASEGGLSIKDRLVFVGHRLIRRYGCFGCHNGIADSQFVFADAGMIRKPNGTLDRAQRIGAELNGWGSKLPDRLDYGTWGHQPSGREAIPHKNRYAWIDHKLSDTRRFDVYPAEQLVDEGKYRYTPTRRLVQKTSEELLKMPLFSFYNEPEKVAAVSTFIVGLVNEPIGVTKQRALHGDEKILEEGARLIADLNCQGCHRIGGRDQFLHYDDLPSFGGYEADPEQLRQAEMEKETWLSRDVNFLAKAKDDASGLNLAAGTLLNKPVYDRSSMSMDDNDTTDDEPISVVELARRDALVRSTPPGMQVLPVAGYQEGGIRFYFGTSGLTRYQAPPPLVRQGERVLSQFLFDFLQDVYPLRAWLKVKMPSFHLSQEDSRTIVRWFKVRSGLPFDGERFAEHEYDEELVMAGKTSFNDEFQCNQCHPTGSRLPTYPIFDPPDSFDYKTFPFAVPESSHYVVWQTGDGVQFKDGFADPFSAQIWAQKNVPEGAKSAVGMPWLKENWGPDLSLAAKRLRPTWVRHWLQSPNDFMPGTKMPGFFGEADPTLDPATNPHPTPENSEKIRLLLYYLSHMERAGVKVSQAK